MKVAILGATGFTGEKIVDILLDHPNAEVTYLSSRTEVPVPYSKLFPKYLHRTTLNCETLDIKKAADCADIFFLSLPHTVSMDFVPYLLSLHKKVIDLSADYRFKDPGVYAQYYKKEHKDVQNLSQAVYGLPEIFADKIAQASLIANPGCYPTSVILALYPLFAQGLLEPKVIVDSQSSITGAGRKAVLEYHYSNISNNIWAYKPFVHQHAPEMTDILNTASSTKLQLLFTPHVAGVEAGIYSTIHVTFKNKTTTDQVRNAYNALYAKCPFVRLNESLPKLKDVVGSNFCDIGFAIDATGTNACIASSIDNLIKGAAGQAIQNMNLMAGVDQTAGLL